MILKGIKNYLINLKYFFTPLGTLFLGVVMGLSAFIPAVGTAVSHVAGGVSNLAESITLDPNALWDSLVSSISALNWSDTVGAIRTMLSSEWLSATFETCVYALVGDVGAYAENIAAVIQDAVETIYQAAVTFLVWTVVGFLVGYFLTKFLVRRNIAKRALWKYFLVSFIDSILSATLVSVCLTIIASIKLKFGAVISFALTFILVGFISLFEAYIVHRTENVKPKEIINMANIGKLFLTNLIILITAVIFVVVAAALTNVLVALFAGLAFLEIAFIVIGMNAEAYVKSFAEKKASESEMRPLMPEN